MKKTVLALGLTVLVTGVAMAQTAPAATAVAVNNKICPISKREVTSMGNAVPVEYNGKVYNLCCSMCAKDFNNDPQAAAKIADEEVAAQATEAVQK